MNIRFVGAAELRRELDAYERRYGMSSSDFLRLFRQGYLPHEPDLVEWAEQYDDWLAAVQQEARGEPCFSSTACWGRTGEASPALAYLPLPRVLELA